MIEEAPRRGHRPVEHTGDLALELWAPTEEELLEEATRAAVAILTGEEAERAQWDQGEMRSVRLDTIDREDRLVQWLNEVIFLAVCEGLIIRHADFEIQGAPGGVLVAHVRGEPLPAGELATELKSATYHDLRVAPGEDGLWRARIVIDV